MKILMGPIVVLCGLAACASASPRADATEIMSVRQVIERFGELDGRAIDVRGWIGGCTQQRCGLFSSRREARRGVITGDAHVVRPVNSFLGGHNEQAVREVVLPVRVAVTCRNSETTICLERRGYLEPVAPARLVRR